MTYGVSVGVNVMVMIDSKELLKKVIGTNVYEEVGKNKNLNDEYSTILVNILITLKEKILRLIKEMEKPKKIEVTYTCSCPSCLSTFYSDTNVSEDIVCTECGFKNG